MTENNMELWNSVCRTDDKYTSKINFGAKLTSINPQSRIQKATELWGPMGFNWGVVGERLENTPGLVVFKITLWYMQDGKRCEVTQFGSAKYSEKDTDCFKKAWTDGTTKCLSLLGFNADIYLNHADDNKYQDNKEKVDKDGIKEFKKLQRQIGIIANKLPLAQKGTLKELLNEGHQEWEWFQLLEMAQTMEVTFEKLGELKKIDSNKYDEIYKFVCSMKDTPVQWGSVLERIRDILSEKEEIAEAMSKTEAPGYWNDR